MLILKETTKAIALSLILLTISISAQSNNSIRGRITDPNQAAIAGAKVTAQNKIGTSVAQTQTNSIGEFEFQDSPRR